MCVCLVVLHLLVFLSVLDPLSCPSSSLLSTAVPVRQHTRPPQSLCHPGCLFPTNCLNELECDLRDDSCRHQHLDSCTSDDKTQVFVDSCVWTSPSLMAEVDPISHWVLSNLRCDVAGFVSASRCGSGTTPQGHYGQQLWRWPCHTIELCDAPCVTRLAMLDGFSVQVDAEPFRDNSKSNSCELSRDNNSSIQKSSCLLSWCCNRHDGTSGLIWS